MLAFRDYPPYPFGVPNKKEIMGFYGLGFHAYGQDWLVDQWRFYSPKKREVSVERNIPKAWITTLLRQRKQNIHPCVLATPVWSLFRLAEIWKELEKVSDNYLLSN
jgi:hypothetical protein